MTLKIRKEVLQLVLKKNERQNHVLSKAKGQLTRNHERLNKTFKEESSALKGEIKASLSYAKLQGLPAQQTIAGLKLLKCKLFERYKGIEQTKQQMKSVQEEIKQLALKQAKIESADKHIAQMLSTEEQRLLNIYDQEVSDDAVIGVRFNSLDEQSYLRSEIQTQEQGILNTVQDVSAPSVTMPVSIPCSQQQVNSDQYSHAQESRPDTLPDNNAQYERQPKQHQEQARVSFQLTNDDGDKKNVDLELTEEGQVRVEISQVKLQSSWINSQSEHVIAQALRQAGIEVEKVQVRSVSSTL